MRGSGGWGGVSMWPHAVTERSPPPQPTLDDSLRLPVWCLRCRVSVEAEGRPELQAELQAVLRQVTAMVAGGGAA